MIAVECPRCHARPPDGEAHTCSDGSLAPPMRPAFQMRPQGGYTCPRCHEWHLNPQPLRDEQLPCVLPRAQSFLADPSPAQVEADHAEDVALTLFRRAEGLWADIAAGVRRAEAMARLDAELERLG